MRMNSLSAWAAALVRVAAIGAAVAAGACSVNRATAPSEVGPSGHALSLTLAASPDIVARDGASTALIRLIARDPQGQPVSGQRLFLSASAGTLSAAEVATASNGEATVVYTAPGVSVPATVAVISATPVGTNADESMERRVSISLAGPTVPVASFTYVPSAPVRFELVSFDGSTSHVGGASCAGCTFEWTFGSEGTASGVAAQHRFQNQGVYQVTLTVTQNGVSGSRTQTVMVGAPTAPAARFTYSPTNPETGDTVHFNASPSAGANGATIVQYTWDFGNGVRTTTAVPTADTVYNAARTHNVQLTVTDSNGQTATATESVSVTEP